MVPLLILLHFRGSMASSIDQLLARAAALEARLARLELQNVAIYHRIEAIILKQPSDARQKEEFLTRVREQVFGPNLFTPEPRPLDESRTRRE